jgi:transcription-repair coupling factor (superfamily II helicase)
MNISPSSFLDHLRSLAAATPPLDRLTSLLEQGMLAEVAGAAASLRAVILANALANRPGLVMAIDSHEAEELVDDLVLLMGQDRVFALPARDTAHHDERGLPLEQRSALIEIYRRLRLGDPLVLVANLRQLLELHPRPQTVDGGMHMLEPGMSLSRNDFIETLERAGFERVSTVEDIAQYAVRGGILDLYPWGHEHPLRLEFYGDEIESIRAFDPSQQTSLALLANVTLALHDDEAEAEADLFCLLRKDTLVAGPPLDHVKSQLELVASGGSEPRLAGDQPRLSTGEVIGHLLRHSRLVFHAGRRPDDEQVLNLRARSQESFMRNLALLTANLRGLHDEGYRTAILCDNLGQRERLREILEEVGLSEERVPLSVGTLHRGFVWHDARLAVYTDHEIFSRPRVRRHIKRFRRATALRRIENLEPGDAVVHVRFGIGIFEGLTAIKVNGHEREVLKLRYANDDRVYVRLEHFRDVEKYSAGEETVVKLSRLGTGEWERTRRKTKASIQNVAKQLIELYARRRMSQGISFGADTIWQKEMEAAFEFEETTDQLAAIAACKEDMEATWPMDRLICGDVGFGKTEVAVRAVFKAVSDGLQAAVLVPTTILAQQHYNTFSARYAEYPARVEVLSRFRTRKEQELVLAELKAGKVDVLIGTHRLLSKDVVFHKLGLLVVDEEQRFGVLHKERIKQLKANLDVITMTATPIPRTLDMAMLGIRDLSLVNVPPSNRLPIETEILPWNPRVIRSAILRELDRNGQVYFVHNRVQSIDTIVTQLRELVPEARFAVAHGQMSGVQLEKVMYEFMRRDFDVLVSTMIIETGLDIPNVNTMIVNRADTFGLAQLYQLRGRIGRSHRQAHAYLLTPSAFQMTPDAKKRLHTIGEFTDLGSGFKIAMRDLEIRGAGNILGSEQSGHISAVGYEHYNRLLEEAILELKDEESRVERPARIECQVELPVDALLPASYVEDAGERVNLYRRLQQAQGADEVQRLRGEVADRFGSLPAEAWMLFQLVELQALGRAALCALVDLRQERLLLKPAAPDESTAQAWLGRVRHLDAAWPVQIAAQGQMALQLDQRGLDWPSRLQQAREILRELGESAPS